MRDLFELDPSITFLNHGSFGACPKPVLAAWQRWQLEIERNPVEFLGRRSAGLLRAARERLAAFVGAQADDLVFVPNATSGVNLVARSLVLNAGDEVLGTDLEYGACDATWQRVCAAQGATYRRVAVSLPLSGASFVAQMAGAITPRTRLVFVSHVASTTALILPVAEVVQAAHARGLPVLVDGAHAPGQIALDLDALGADFYTGNGHKWLCGPRGTGFVHARRDHHRQLHALVTSWGYAEGTGGHAGFDAFLGRGLLERRLQWQGTRDLSGFLALPAAIDFHEQHLGAAVRAQCHQQAVQAMADAAAHWGIEAIGQPGDFAQMAPLPLPAMSGTEAEALRQRLFDEHRIEVPVTQHAGRSFVRVSVQVYNDPGDLQRLLAALRGICG